MVNENWEKFVEAYCLLFSEKREVVEKLAVHDVLQLSVSGYSNMNIAKRLDMDATYVEDVCNEFLGFPGFQEDLDINPYNIFRRSISLDDFTDEIRLISAVLDIDYDLCYNICVSYDNLRKELEIWD